MNHNLYNAIEALMKRGIPSSFLEKIDEIKNLENCKYEDVIVSREDNKIEIQRYNIARYCIKVTFHDTEHYSITSNMFVTDTRTNEVASIKYSRVTYISPILDILCKFSLEDNPSIVVQVRQMTGQDINWDITSNEDIVKLEVLIRDLNKLEATNCMKFTIDEIGKRMIMFLRIPKTSISKIEYAIGKAIKFRNNRFILKLVDEIRQLPEDVILDGITFKRQGNNNIFIRNGDLVRVKIVDKDGQRDVVVELRQRKSYKGVLKTNDQSVVIEI